VSISSFKNFEKFWTHEQQLLEWQPSKEIWYSTKTHPHVSLSNNNLYHVIVKHYLQMVIIKCQWLVVPFSP